VASPESVADASSWSRMSPHAWSRRSSACLPRICPPLGNPACRGYGQRGNGTGGIPREIDCDVPNQKCGNSFSDDNIPRPCGRHRHHHHPVRCHLHRRGGDRRREPARHLSHCHRRRLRHRHRNRPRPGLRRRRGGLATPPPPHHLNAATRIAADASSLTRPLPSAGGRQRRTVARDIFETTVDDFETVVRRAPWRILRRRSRRPVPDGSPSNCRRRRAGRGAMAVTGCLSSRMPRRHP
jgi:hypothetical protein